MGTPGKRPQRRPRRIETRRQTYSTGAKAAIWASILAVCGLLALVGMLVSRASRYAVRPPTKFSTSAPPRPKPPPKPSTVTLTEAERAELRKQYQRPDTPETPRRAPLRERIEKEYQAARRRAALYVRQERWGDAIRALELVLDRYDDEELRLRADPELVELRRRANRAFKAKLAEADDHARAGRFADARKALESVIATFGIEDFTGPAKEALERLAAREEAAAAARFERAMAAVDALLPAWRFEQALAEARKLKFQRPKYQKALAARIRRIQALLDLKNKIIERIINARPRLSKRAFHVPGLPGELAIADQEHLFAITDRGEEKIAWERLGPIAAQRLALAAGDKADPSHRLAVARLLMELGHLDAAAGELQRARELGADPANDEAELARRRRRPAGPKSK